MKQRNCFFEKKVNKFSLDAGKLQKFLFLHYERHMSKLFSSRLLDSIIIFLCHNASLYLFSCYVWQAYLQAWFVGIFNCMKPRSPILIPPEKKHSTFLPASVVCSPMPFFYSLSQFRYSSHHSFASSAFILR